MINSFLRSRSLRHLTQALAAAGLVAGAAAGGTPAQAASPASISAFSPNPVWASSPPGWWTSQNPSLVISGTGLKGAGKVVLGFSSCGDSDATVKVPAGAATGTSVSLPISAVTVAGTNCRTAVANAQPAPVTIPVTVENAKGQAIASVPASAANALGLTQETDPTDGCADLTGNLAGTTTFQWKASFLSCSGTETAVYTLTIESADGSTALNWVPNLAPPVNSGQGTTSGTTCTATSSTVETCSYSGPALAEWDVNGATNTSFRWDLGISASSGQTDRFPDPAGESGPVVPDPLGGPGTSMN